jgi:hypothetical protein
MAESVIIKNDVFECTSYVYPRPLPTEAHVYYFQLHSLKNVEQIYLDLLCNSIHTIVQSVPCVIILDCSSVTELALMMSFFKLSLENFQRIDRAQLVKFVMITSCVLLRKTANVVIRFKNAAEYAIVVASKEEAYNALQ